MSTINVLKTVITASDDGFSKTFAEATTSARQFNQMLKDGEALYKATRTPLENYEAEVSKLQNLLDQGAISQETFNRALAKMEQSPFGAAKSTNMLTASLSKMVPVFDPISLALKVLSAGFDLAKEAASAFADAIVDSVIGGINRMDALDDAANKIGVTTEALSALRFAAGYADVEIGVIDASIGKMNVNIAKAAQDGGKAAEMFEKIGLDAKALRAAGPEKAFGMIADAINALPNSMDRARAANDIFSKSYREMVPLLQLGSEGLQEVTERGRDMGQVISAIDASNAAAAADAIKELEDKWTGLQNVLAMEVAPIVTGIAKAFGSIGDGDMVANARAFFDAVLKDLQVALNMADQLGKLLSNAFTGGATMGINNRPLIGDMMIDNIEKARAKAIADAIERTKKPPQGAPLDLGDIGNDGASALGNTPFDREAERLRESLRTPLEVLQDELTKFGDMFAEGSIDVETLNRALAKAEADYEKTLPKLTGAGKMDNVVPPMAGQAKPYDATIAALEQGSAGAFSAINRARGGGSVADKQLDVARRQQKLQEQIAANTARKPMVANIAG